MIKHGFTKFVDDEFGKNHNFPTPSKRPRYKHYKQIRQGHCNESETYVVRKFDIGTDDVQHFDLHSQINKDIAVTERVCQSNITDKYNPDYNKMDQIADEIVNRIGEKMRPFEELFNLDAMDEYIDTRKGYTRKQKESIKMVRKDAEILDWLTLLRENWNQLYFDEQGELHMKGLINPIAKKARFRAFIKDESYPEYKRPRNITGASDVDKYILGVVFGEFNHAFFSLEQTIKKTPYDDRPRVISERLGDAQYCYIIDHTAFESAATKDIQIHCEQRIYRSIYPAFEDYAMKYADPLIFACGRIDPSIYVVDSSRASGAPNTSLGNSINNYIFIRMLEDHFGASFRFMIEGDDCIINSNIEIDVAEAKEFAFINGFDIKMDQVDHYCTAGFLSTIWNCDDYVADTVNKWKHLVDAFTFRPQQVMTRKEIDNKAYWKIQTSKLLSMTLLNPKHELFYELFLGAYEFYKYYHGNKYVKIYDRRHKGLQVNVNCCNDSLISKVYAHMSPQHFAETRGLLGYNQELVDFIHKLVMSHNEYYYQRAVTCIINLYHDRENSYYKTLY